MGRLGLRGILIVLSLRNDFVNLGLRRIGIVVGYIVVAAVVVEIVDDPSRCVCVCFLIELLIGSYSVILVDLFLPSTYQQVHVKIRKRMKISSQPRGNPGEETSEMVRMGRLTAESRVSISVSCLSGGWCCILVICFRTL